MIKNTIKKVIVKYLHKLGEDSKDNFNGCIFVSILYICCALACFVFSVHWWFFPLGWLCVALSSYMLLDAIGINRRMKHE